MDKTKERIAELERRMSLPDFWQHKENARAVIKELQELRAELSGGGKYDKGDAIMTIFSGAGGDDAEDFSRMLYEMYLKYLEKKGWSSHLIHKNENDRGGYRNITIEIQGKNAYGTLKNESGVHRLVRISPFSSKKLRHTSFSMVEVIPKFEKEEEVEILPQDIKVEFTRSSGPGGQNVNKRDTAVRIVHLPTKIAVHVESERSQAQNRERAMAILRGKLYKRMREERERAEKSMQVSKTTDIEWGNQIRSYVLHPYKLVKDHRTGVEVRNAEEVLEKGQIEPFLDAEKSL
jgi:peptide chain release factor 2